MEFGLDENCFACVRVAGKAALVMVGASLSLGEEEGICDPLGDLSMLSNNFGWLTLKSEDTLFKSAADRDDTSMIEPFLDAGSEGGKIHMLTILLRDEIAGSLGFKITVFLRE